MSIESSTMLLASMLSNETLNVKELDETQMNRLVHLASYGAATLENLSRASQLQQVESIANASAKAQAGNIAAEAPPQPKAEVFSQPPVAAPQPSAPPVIAPSNVAPQVFTPAAEIQPTEADAIFARINQDISDLSTGFSMEADANFKAGMEGEKSKLSEIQVAQLRQNYIDLVLPIKKACQEAAQAGAAPAVADNGPAKIQMN
jgi:hypothetical protein